MREIDTEDLARAYHEAVSGGPKDLSGIRRALKAISSPEQVENESNFEIYPKLAAYWWCLRRDETGDFGVGVHPSLGGSPVCGMAGSEVEQMLPARPSRPKGPSRFRALGCQGGKVRGAWLGWWRPSLA